MDINDFRGGRLGGSESRREKREKFQARSKISSKGTRGQQQQAVSLSFAEQGDGLVKRSDQGKERVVSRKWICCPLKSQPAAVVGRCITTSGRLLHNRGSGEGPTVFPLLFLFSFLPFLPSFICFSACLVSFRRLVCSAGSQE